MQSDGAKATSVTAEGEPDGWTIQRGYRAEMDHSGSTRLVVSVPTAELATVHAALAAAMGAPLSVLYRQVVDRLDPKPQGTPPRDFIALGLDHERVSAALMEHGALVYHDARCELWLRGQLQEQVVLDPDGLLYCYPDDPMFRDTLQRVGVEEVEIETLLERDYVRHWFVASCDEVEQQMIRSLNLTEVAPQ
jgi:hypothetical protein